MNTLPTEIIGLIVAHLSKPCNLRQVDRCLHHYINNYYWALPSNRLVFKYSLEDESLALWEDVLMNVHTVWLNHCILLTDYGLQFLSGCHTLHLRLCTGIVLHTRSLSLFLFCSCIYNMTVLYTIDDVDSLILLMLMIC
eukprot:TRINITY_DN953_c0_g1_i3.p1 TRINITY_DN953_c0_g1~~TRINITY_DN953_c0_g1_i3.p1  ORF type:complete len:139 (+),score=8.05 TRINITY_DN953_c0_g1_i3:83-499(+)